MGLSKCVVRYPEPGATDGSCAAGQVVRTGGVKCRGNTCTAGKGTRRQQRDRSCQRYRRRGRSGCSGGKGASLAEMANISLPVPPEILHHLPVTVTYSSAGNVWPTRRSAGLTSTARTSRKRTGRSSATGRPAAVSTSSLRRPACRGMMDAPVSNLSLNDDSVRVSQKTKQPRFGAATPTAASSRCSGRRHRASSGQLFGDAINACKKMARCEARRRAQRRPQGTSSPPSSKQMFSDNVDPRSTRGCR